MAADARVPADGAVPADRVVTADSIGGVLVDVTARAVAGRAADDLGEPTVVSRARGFAAAAEDEALARGAARVALSVEDCKRIDTDAVAARIVGQYPDQPYPAVVLGSPHGAAAHLATTLGVPWLPAGFELTVRWPDGAVDDPEAAQRHGAACASALLGANPDVSVRQVHDPVVRGPAAGTTISLFVRWRRLPPAYRRLLGRIRPGGFALTVADSRTWPVFGLGGGHSFQLGGPTSGLAAAEYVRPGPDLVQALRRADGDPHAWLPPAVPPLRGLGEHAPEPGFEADLRDWPAEVRRHRIAVARPGALSAAVAQTVRAWLVESGKTGDRLAVGCGRLLDPGQVLRCGLVPYWCEAPLREEVAEAEIWVAGSPPFRSIDVLIEPPGRPSAVVAPLRQWDAVAWFSSQRAAVDRVGTRSYPYGTLPTRHASVVLAELRDDLPLPAPLTPGTALERLRRYGEPVGLVVD
ncbi:hypothetical protein GCM10010124_40880 [Pilimelia terevasa]|uniref:Uncharacterized protein n=1 Tax=Pilimelia terevasa TaxID=53372 RepID=A0A8J3BQS2_9ACTN|nr:hypothetical protein [Pilimelia terevasa]GGK43875.1 hypothetical protein GCM10010124_40880 [Pilimelia terevasa]